MATQTGKKVTVKFKNTNGTVVQTLTSTDGGKSFEGNFCDNKSTPLWLLEIPNPLVSTTLSDNELRKILTSADGYTLVAFKNISGYDFAILGEMYLSEDGTCSISFDDGTKRTANYKISDGKLYIGDGESGYNIYGDATYMAYYRDGSTSASGVIHVIR
jgi:hypothetical protein